MLISAFVIGACSGGGSSAPTANAGTGTGTGTGTDACIGATSKWALWTGVTCLRGSNVLLGFFNGVDAGVSPTFSQADFNNLAAMGANVVNISHPGLYSETPPYVLNTEAQANLDSLLTMIKNANMFAVITARSGPGRNTDWIGTLWTSQAEQDAWVAMWKYTADRYKNNSVVVGYDLMCEPYQNEIISPPTDIPSVFYPAYANTLYDWNPLAKRISDAIRQVDTTTPILIGGMNYSAAPWLNSLTSNGDNKTVYMVHNYEPHETYTHQPAPYTNTYGTTTGTYTRADLLPPFAYISTFKSSRSAPVGINEFGVMRFQPGAGQYLNDEMDIMEGYGLNYSVFSWYPPSVAALHDSFDFRRGTDPNNHAEVSPNALTTVLQKYFQKNTVRPSNRGF